MFLAYHLVRPETFFLTFLYIYIPSNGPLRGQAPCKLQTWLQAAVSSSSKFRLRRFYGRHHSSSSSSKGVWEIPKVQLNLPAPHQRTITNILKVKNLRFKQYVIEQLRRPKNLKKEEAKNLSASNTIIFTLTSTQMYLNPTKWHFVGAVKYLAAPTKWRH